MKEKTEDIKSREYRSVIQVAGPLMIVEGVEEVAFEDTRRG